MFQNPTYTSQYYLSKIYKKNIAQQEENKLNNIVDSTDNKQHTESKQNNKSNICNFLNTLYTVMYQYHINIMTVPERRIQRSNKNVIN